METLCKVKLVTPEGVADSPEKRVLQSELTLDDLFAT